MQIIKPMHQGLMYRTFAKEKRFYLSVASLSFFPFHNPEALSTEQQMWETLNANLHPDMVFDECMPKDRGEVLIMGSCRAPGDTPVERLFVDLDIGAIRKRVVVTGDRFWTRGDPSNSALGRMLAKDWYPTEPVPFTKMDMGWKNALGGQGFEHNPWGKGYLPTETQPALDETSPLPNVEPPEKMMAGPWSVAEPAGCGPIHVLWPQRAGKVGKKYDKRWEKELYPGPASDMDPTYYNAAPEDQQLPSGFWSGDEEIALTHMHPEQPDISTRLPAVRPRCFVLQRKDDGPERWSEVPLVPETVWLFPNVLRGILVSRGVFEIDTFYGVDVDTVLLAWELKDGRSRSPEDYRTSVRLRQDDETSADWSAREDDLSPPEGIPEEEEIFVDEDDEEEEDKGPDPRLAAMEKKAGGVLDKAKQMLLDVGLDPLAYLPEALSFVPPPVSKPPALKKMSDVGTMLEYMDAEFARAEAEAAKIESGLTFANAKTKEEAEEKIHAKAREICEKVGQDYDELLAKAKQKPPSSKPAVQKFAELIGKAKVELADYPDKVAKLDGALAKLQSIAPPVPPGKVDPEMQAMLRDIAHHADPPELPDAALNLELRSWVIERHAAKESLAENDLSGVDLSGLDLKGADFKGALLDSANLKGAKLQGADFTEATVARVDFTEAVLEGAVMVKAGAGAARFERADLTGADLTDAVVEKCDFRGAVLKGAVFKPEMVQDADCTGASFEGAVLEEAEVLNSLFEDARFEGADLTKASFMECRMDRADFSRAKLCETSFVGVLARECSFREAQVKDANAHLDSDFSNSDFTGAHGEGLNLAETNLSGCCFAGAILNGADFSQSTLRQARFDKAILKEASFTDADLTGARLAAANLMGASFQGTDLNETDLSNAHLFGADFLFAQLEDTDCRGAVIRRTSLEEEA